MNLYLKELYHNFVIVFVLLVFGVGLQWIAHRALVYRALLHQTLEVICLCAIICVPLTLYNIFKGIKPHVTKEATFLANTVMVCAFLAYLAFLVLGLTPMPVEELHM